MGHRLRIWLTGLCTVCTVAILFWALSGERNYWESAQFRVIRTNVGDSQLNSGGVTKNRSDNLTGATQGSVKHKDAQMSQKLSPIQPNTSRADVSTSVQQQRGGRRPAPVDGSGSPPRPRVLLVSYMRSGSTFTGDIFQSLADVFYLYEPLLYVNDDDYITPLARPSRSRLIPNAMGIPNPPEVHNYTLDVLNCKLTDHNLRFLYGLSYSKSTTDFDACQKKLGEKPSKFAECGRQLRKRCESSRAVVTKILRLKMWEVEKLLAADKDLRVIHLVRDPRAVSVSRRAVRYYFIEKPFCSRLNADSKVSAELQVKYPGRVLTTRYEDLATNAPEIARILFQFSGIPWSKAVEDNLASMTANADVQTKEHVFNTKRKNSALTASSWRQKIPFETAKRLQRFCKKSMEVYGYIPFNSHQELQDQNLSSFSRDYSDQFYKAQHAMIAIGRYLDDV